MENLLQALNKMIWGPVTLCLFLGTGLFFLIVLKFLPWRNLLYALRLVFLPHRQNESVHGEISAFASLMTSLGACMGTGNIVGVACAMTLGGPGALVWMCVSAMLGLPTIFAECVLAIRYRRRTDEGRMCGGPMYVMHDGIGGSAGQTLALLFSVLTVGASFGIGNMTQSNAVAVSMKEIWQVPSHISGIILTLAVCMVLIGGIRSIGNLCRILVPAASVLYLGCAAVVIAVNVENVMPGLKEIFRMAFSVKSVTCGVGGAVSASMFQAMQWGIARGVFSNEAGLGSAPIAAAAAQTDNAVRQGYMHMTGVFLDTVVMCSVTGLAIAASGVLGIKDSHGALLTGVRLTIKAFETVSAYGGHVICFCMLLFALPTLFGWAYYGEKALAYCTRSPKMIYIYRVIYCAVCFAGAVRPLQFVWAFADIMNGLMALPNLICLWMMHHEVRACCLAYEKENT